MTIDDSALFHYSAGYDPAKAREYYLRTRKLKGRNRGGSEDPGGGRSGGSSAPRPRAAKGKARPTEWKSHKQQVAALQQRLETLRRVLSKLVEDAKERSGVETKSKTEKTSSTKETSSKSDSKSEKKTAEQKRKDAERQKEYREKQKPELDRLREQIKDTREKIQEALEAAREREAARKKREATRKSRSTTTSKNQTASKGR